MDKNLDRIPTPFNGSVLESDILPGKFITFQKHYDIKYLSMRLSGCTNDSEEPLRHGTEYLMHHQHEPIMYSKNKISN